MLEANMARFIPMSVLALALALVPVQADARPKDGVAVVAVGLNMLVLQESSSLSLSGEKMQNLGFDIGVYYRLPMLDVGLRVGHFGHGTFQPDSFGGGFVGRQKSVSQILVEADFRWRVEESEWGGYFTAVSVGYAGILNSDAMLNQPRDESFDVPIERFHSAISISISSGVLVYVTDQILVPLRAGMHVSTTAEKDQSFAIVTLWIGTGIEFAP
jgi:hypothetical protein